MAGHTLSNTDYANRSSRRSKPSTSQSFISFAAVSGQSNGGHIVFIATGTRTIQVLDREAERAGRLQQPNPHSPALAANSHPGGVGIKDLKLK
jgi:hypothetical protein